MRVIGTAGHVDHGKSSLVIALTGTDPDRFDEEQRRGMTIDLGFAHTTLPGGEEISIIDVPGHVRFIRNMLAGVGAIDACLFVVAATEGWKPQSEEHLRIIELLGVRHGVIALTKVDLADADDAELAQLDIEEHVAGTVLDDAPIVPVSTVTGEGLDLLRAELAALAARTPAAQDRDRPRLWVDRSFAARGSGTVVTGTLTGGQVAHDDHLDLLPAGDDVRVRGIQTHGRAVERVGPGHRVALNLGNVDHRDVRRGDAIVRAAQWRPTSRFDASLQTLASLDHVVSRRGAFTAHIGAGEWPVRLRVLGPDSIRPGERGLVRLHLAHALPLVAGDRFVLRESGRDETVGGGEVLDVRPVRPASKATPDRSTARVVAEHGWIDAADLLALTGEAIAPDVGRWVVDPADLASRRDRIAVDAQAAGALGLDVATLDERARSLLPHVAGVHVANGRVFADGAVDELAAHPLLERLRAQGTTPEDVRDVDRATIRSLVRRQLLVERDGMLFHPDTIDRAAEAASVLLAAHPDGITVSQFRDTLAVSRKFGVPLLNELDARGITRRRGDLRIAGPRLPTPPDAS